MAATSLAQQIALLVQRQEILIGTVDTEFRGFRTEINLLMARQIETEKKAITEESRLTTGLKRLDKLYDDYGIDRRQQGADMAELKNDMNSMKNSLSILIKITVIIGTAGGMWIINNLLGLIK